MKFQNYSLFLFRLFGVNVYVHWTWLLVGAAEIARRDNAAGLAGHQQPLLFYIAEYLALFLLVLLHEFGHALACKSVKGKADRILLWPLGGLAYVQPPPRPGPTLWSIAAGPLVNLVLLPVLFGAAVLAAVTNNPLLAQFTNELFLINLVLLLFNLLPVYPLDGGQILRSLLWFVTSRATSLRIAAWIGIAVSVCAASLCLAFNQLYLALMAGYLAYRSFRAIKIADAYAQLDRAPLHLDAQCPKCNEHPPAGPFWKCPCGAKFDTFDTGPACPSCAKPFQNTACPRCTHSSPRPLWHSTTGFTVTTPVQPTATPNPTQPTL